MAITTNIVIPLNNLAGNAVNISLYAGPGLTKRYRIYQINPDTGVYDILLYEGSVMTLTDVYAIINIRALFASLRHYAGIMLCKAFLVSDADVKTDETPFIVYGGGISKLMLRQLSGASIFDTKLKASNTNFFLTTRTSDRIISIPEDELLPLNFYSKGHKFKIRANETELQAYNYTTDPTERLVAIDFAFLRSQLVASGNVLINVFDIVTDTSYSCSLVITEAETRTDYFLKFRNSWGAYDKIGIRGTVNFAPEFSDVTSIDEYDTTVSDFVIRNQRKKATNTLTATTGYKTDNERLLLLDMLFSKDVTFIAHGVEYAVNVSSDSSLFATSDPTALDINLKIKLIDTEDNFSALIITNQYEVLADTTLENITTGNADIIL